MRVITVVVLCVSVSVCLSVTTLAIAYLVYALEQGAIRLIVWLSLRNFVQNF